MQCYKPSVTYRAYTDFRSETLKSHLHLIILIVRQALSYLSIKRNKYILTAWNLFPGTPSASSGHIEKPRQIFLLKHIDWNWSLTNTLPMWTFHDSIYSNWNLFTTRCLINRTKSLTGIAPCCCPSGGLGGVTWTSFKATMWNGRKVSNSESHKDRTSHERNQSYADEWSGSRQLTILGLWAKQQLTP